MELEKGVDLREHSLVACLSAHAQSLYHWTPLPMRTVVMSTPHHDLTLPGLTMVCNQWLMLLG